MTFPFISRTTMPVYQYSYEVGEKDIEPMWGYGHVHHAHTLHFLEEARVQFLKDIDASMESLLSQEIFPVVASIFIEYKRELLLGKITVNCEELRVDGKSLFVRQKLLNERGRLVVEALVELKFMDGKSKRAGPVPEKIQAAC